MCGYVSWSNQFFREVPCSEKQLLNKPAVMKASLFSFIGMGNFYSEHYFNGAFELVQGVIAIFLVTIWPSWLCKLREHVKNLISVGLLILLIVSNILEAIHMFCTGIFEVYFMIMIISLILASCLRYKCGIQLQCTTFSMIIALSNVTLNTLLISNLLMVEFNFKLDGHSVKVASYICSSYTVSFFCKHIATDHKYLLV